jgi:hypothetical protein
MAQAAPTLTHLAAGELAQKSNDHLVLAVPGTDYRLQLAAAGPIPAQVGDRVRGTIRAQAMRVDVIASGGRYIEPVYGRPRRLQGRIVGGDVAANSIVVHTGPVPVVCTLAVNQKAGQFAVGQLVSFDVRSGASFTLEQ